MTNNSDFDSSVSTEAQSLSPGQHRVYAKFSDSLEEGNDTLLPAMQTNLITIEPYLKVKMTEDEVTKNFYENKMPGNVKKADTKVSTRERQLSEIDSLEDEKSSLIIGKEGAAQKTNETIQQSTSSSIKSILKKSKKRTKSSERLNFDEVLQLAEQNARMNSTPNSIYQRSLFDQTINIFDPNRPSYSLSNEQCRFRSQFYIKPYREKPNVPSENINNNRRARSLSQNRLGQQTDDINHGSNDGNQRSRPSARKQHVSWSPVREYMRQGRDSTGKITAAKGNLKQSRSTTPIKKFNQETSHLVAPISTSPPSSIDLFHTPSASEISLTVITSKPQERSVGVKPNHTSKSEKSPVVSQRRKQHDETMEKYDRLLEKMRTTDEQLQSLSRSWTSKKQPQVPGKPDRDSSLSLNRMTRDDTFFSPATLQICLFILVLTNLLVVYFFREINVWWSQHVTPGITVQQHNEDSLNF